MLEILWATKVTIWNIFVMSEMLYMGHLGNSLVYSLNVRNVAGHPGYNLGIVGGL